MPTAVMIESTENTRSSSRIWKIAPPSVTLTACPTMSSLWSVGSTVWWISLVAFQTRNSPPAIRIRSRQEKSWPKAEKTGAVMPDDVGDGREQDQPHDQRRADAEAARPHAMLGRQLVGQDRDEDQVVDPEHHFHGDQRHHRRPALRTRQEGKWVAKNSAIGMRLLEAVDARHGPRRAMPGYTVPGMRARGAHARPGHEVRRP